MNCGTTSDIAWPMLREGVTLSTTVTDREAHEAVLELKSQRDGTIDPGPCGAAPFAALKKIITDGPLGDISKLDVVCFCTEGAREYVVPI